LRYPCAAKAQAAIKSAVAGSGNPKEAAAITQNKTVYL
jgi:hypothetical protein